MTKYNWNYLFELGYTEEEMEDNENSWADAILKVLSDVDLKDTIKENAKVMLSFFDKSQVFSFMVYYNSTFLLDPQTFKERFYMIQEKLGEKWKVIIESQFYNNASNTFLESMGYLQNSEWENFLIRLSDPTNMKWKFIEMINNELEIDISVTDYWGEDDFEELNLLETCRYELLESCKYMRAIGFSEAVIEHILWMNPYFLIGDVQCNKEGLEKQFGDDFIEKIENLLDEDIDEFNEVLMLM